MIKSILSYEFLSSAIRVTVPIILSALAALVQRKANILCICNESIMLFAALGGVVASAWTNSLFLGFIGGIVAGELIALIFSYFVLKLDTDPMLIALALNIFGSGGTIFLLFLITGDKGSSISLASKVFPIINIPLIEDIPVLGKILSGHNLMVYVSAATLVVVAWLVNKSRLGLRIRAVGENPEAAKSVGIKVSRYRLIAMLIGGFIASLGGMYMSMGYLTCFSRDMVMGRSFIGIAAQNLGAGNPWITAIASLVFGVFQAVANTAQSFRMPAHLANMVPYIVTLLGLIAMGVYAGRNEKNRIKKTVEANVQNKSNAEKYDRRNTNSNE